MTARELKRFLPVAIIGIVVLAIAVLVMGDNDPTGGGSATASDAPANPERAKPPETGSNAAKSVAITPQSTEKVSGPHDDAVPILMYHVTKTAPTGTPYPDLWVSKADFQGQMNWLKDNGYTGITMAQLFKYWDEGYRLPDKPVVLTFDDGYPSHDKIARPILAKLGWPGTLFLEIKNVGSPETGFTAKMVKNLIASGWEIGSHTINHPDLTKIGAAQLKSEVEDSRKQIAAKYDVSVDYFCYPAGRFNDSVVSAVERAGYTGATTTVEGLATRSKPFELKRIRIGGSDGVNGFAAKMRQAEQ
ncbi:MAG: polysaccharide deacetylase family protein [Solirubrobacterales bacterium]